MSIGLANQGVSFSAGFSFHFVAVSTFVAGAMFMMWLGEQITERGVGNGISMLIFSGIVAGLPRAIGQSSSLHVRAISTSSLWLPSVCWQ
ncbi:Protein translocase subunit SecY [Pseudomonas sp. FEN]|nr:Protein translocase subunit SecY [Pseudomonas sp. FEN]